MSKIGRFNPLRSMNVFRKYYSNLAIIFWHKWTFWPHGDTGGKIIRTQKILGFFFWALMTYVLQRAICKSAGNYRIMEQTRLLVRNAVFTSCLT